MSSVETRSANFPAFCGCEESLVESQRMSPVVFISFHRLSCCIHFLSPSFHFAFVPFHIAFISFHFAFMSFHIPVRWVSAQTLTLSFLLLLRYRFGGLCRLPSQASWTCTYVYVYISSLSFFVPLIVFWAGNAMAVLKCELKCNARDYYILVCAIPHQPKNVSSVNGSSVCA